MTIESVEESEEIEEEENRCPRLLLRLTSCSIVLICTLLLVGFVIGWMVCAILLTITGNDVLMWITLSPTFLLPLIPLCMIVIAVVSASYLCVRSVMRWCVVRYRNRFHPVEIVMDLE